MSQTLDLEVTIPEEYVLINKDELQQRLNASLTGKIWTMKDLEQQTKRSNDWLKEKILFPYRKELDVNNGGFVRYPEKQGSPWKFGAYKMSQWLEQNLDKII